MYLCIKWFWMVYVKSSGLIYTCTSHLFWASLLMWPAVFSGGIQLNPPIFQVKICGAKVASPPFEQSHHLSILLWPLCSFRWKVRNHGCFLFMLSGRTEMDSRKTGFFPHLLHYSCFSFHGLKPSLHPDTKQTSISRFGRGHHALQRSRVSQQIFQLSEHLAKELPFFYFILQNSMEFIGVTLVTNIGASASI